LQRQLLTAQAAVIKDRTVAAKTLHPPWPPAVVQAICDVLACRDWPGLTHTEISQLLALQRIADDGTEAPNKRTRLWSALMQRQQRNRASNCIIKFITDAMAPARYLQDQRRFDALRDGLNEALSLVGLQVTVRGQMGRAEQTATTLDEVALLAGRLRTELRRRGVHVEVLKYCEEELIRKSLFHAVFEATKGVSERLRQLSGSMLDGADLVDYCFSGRSGTPIIRINAFQTRSEVSEHTGFANLLKGLFGMFRNPPAHTPRAVVGWTVTEPDCLDYFSTLSLLHRRLDAAVVTTRP
jgi:uncharacterized protein (TIGR02391 family)